jgi:hypothetical protein
MQEMRKQRMLGNVSRLLSAVTVAAGLAAQCFAQSAKPDETKPTAIGVPSKPAPALDLAEQIHQLQEADRKRQAELEELKESNQALKKELEKLTPHDGHFPPLSDHASSSDADPGVSINYDDPYKSDPNESPLQPGSPLVKAANAGYTRLGGSNSSRDGFYITNADGTFSIHIHNRLQFGYTYDQFNHRETRNGLISLDRLENRSDFHFVREYFTINGNAWSKDLYYQVTTEAFTAPPLNETIRLRYCWIDYNVLHGLCCVDDYSQCSNALVLRAGMWKGRFGREFPANDGQLQLVDRSLATIAFNEGRIRGVEMHGSTVYFEEDRDPETGKTINRPGRFAYFVELGDSIDDPTSAFALDSSQLGNPVAGATPRGLDGKPFISGRLQYDVLRGWYTYVLPDGQVVRYNDFRFDEANDLAYHEEPALQIGASYIWHQDDFDTRPQDFPLMNRFFHGKNIKRYEADFGFKYRGFSLTGEYFLENLDPQRFSIYNRINGSTGAVIPLAQRPEHTSSGWYVRDGYFFIPRRLEMYSRVSGLYSGNQTLVAGTAARPVFLRGPKITDAWEYTAGIGYYPTGHHYLKLQLEFGYNTNVPLSNEKPEFTSETRESDFIMRAQFQVEF